MSNNVICEKSCKQPKHTTLDDPHISLELGHIDEPVIWVCVNGLQSTGIDLPRHMYELLRELVNDLKVIEYYENLRGNLHAPT